MEKKQLLCLLVTYTLSSLIADLNSTFSENNISLNISLRNDNHIVIYSSEPFSLINDKQSLLHLFGFVDKQYNDSNQYISDNKYVLDASVIQFIQIFYFNNGKKNLITRIDSPYKDIITKNFDPINSLQQIIIKIKQNSDRLYDLCRNTPKMNIHFITEK